MTASLYEFKYIKPQPDENSIMKDEIKREELIKEYYDIADKFIELTQKWIEEKNDTESSLFDERKTLSEDIDKVYAKLDPYIRSRTFYHRIGVLSDNGVNWSAAK